MAFTPFHAAVGISIVKMIPNPWISLPLAFLSHIVADLYPEWYDTKGRYTSDLKKIPKLNDFDWKEKTLGITQICLAVFVLTYLILNGNWVMWVAAILANGMDLWDLIYERIKGANKFFWFQHGGWFPFKLSEGWQTFGLLPLQNSGLDILFIIPLLLLK